MKNISSVLIGKTKSLTSVNLPRYVNPQLMNIFLNNFSLNDLLDIYCMAEYLNLVFYRLDSGEALQESITALILIFQTKVNEPEFERALENAKISDSISRAREGKALVVQAYRLT